MSDSNVLPVEAGKPAGAGQVHADAYGIRMQRVWLSGFDPKPTFKPRGVRRAQQPATHLALPSNSIVRPLMAR
jgi:hypothetical protein